MILIRALHASCAHSQASTCILLSLNRRVKPGVTAHTILEFCCGIVEIQYECVSTCAAFYPYFYYSVIQCVVCYKYRLNEHFNRAVVLNHADNLDDQRLNTLIICLCED
jgi:hypothetical protein